MRKRILCFLAVLLLCAASACRWGWQTAFAESGGRSVPAPPNGRGAASVPVVTQSPAAQPSFEIHFIDVGQGDSALVLCDGAAMLIDGGNTGASSRIYAYLKAQNTTHLDCVVATHADADHVGGLSGALNYASVDAAFCSVTEGDSVSFGHLLKYLGEQGVGLTVPGAGDSFMLGSARVDILGPRRFSENGNDLSIVLKITYGRTSFLFMGDAEYGEEIDMIEAGCDLSATVLKAGHHGSGSSTSSELLDACRPQYAVISVGAGNDYGHPSDRTLNRLQKAGAAVLRTDELGTIICRSDGETVSFSAIAEEPEAEQTVSFIGNINSQTFHRSTCPNLPAERNRIYFETREEAVEAEFKPCGFCRP